MKQLKDLLESNEVPRKRGRPPNKRETPEFDGKYSTIFHSITEELKLDTPLKITVFANIEGLSRGKNYCVINIQNLAFLSGCSKSELLSTLDEFENLGLVEKGEDSLNRLGWRLTEEIRSHIGQIKRKLSSARAFKHMNLRP